MKYYQLSTNDLQLLFDAVLRAGYRLIAPTLSQSAIVYDEITRCDDLPQSHSDQLSPGQYRVFADNHRRYFYWTNTAQSLKPLLFKAREKLWQVREIDGELEFESPRQDEQPIAVLGARACDLAGLQLQDQHFLYSGCADSYYAKRRENMLIIGVDCAQSASTCFCASTGDGPSVTAVADVALSELGNGFLLRSMSEAGNNLLATMKLSVAGDDMIAEAQSQTENAIQQQQRQLPAELNLEMFAGEHSTWEWLQQTCLSCGNCTLVCPSCYCHSEYDEPDLGKAQSAHYREWSSCFTEQHSYMHGIIIRSSTALRYKQWITHKLVHWKAQYGRSGCVGCGRCIAWCPVGIDISAIANDLVAPTEIENA